MKKLRIITLVLFLLSAGLLGASYAYHMQMDDATVPVITCPEEPLILSVGEHSDAKLLEGVTAWDDKDGDLTQKVLIQGMSKRIEGDTTTITYAVVDSDAHVSTCSRPVTYTDYTKPRFALSRELRYTVGGMVQVKDRLTAEDVMDGDISDRIKVTSSGLTAYSEGTYPVTFEVTNSLGDSSVLTLDIVVRNYVSGEPRIYLSQYLVYMKAGGSFEPMDYLESVSGGSPESVSVASDLNRWVPGVYPVSYSCTAVNGSIGSTVLYVVVE